MEIPTPLQTNGRLLLGPGPSDASPQVLRAMSSPLLGHLDPEFMQIMARVQAMLREAFRTSNPVTFPVSATGMAGMECCIVNLLEPGDRVVVFTLGFFGNRMVEVAGRTGAQVTVVEGPWGKEFSLEQIGEAIKKVRPKVVALVHAETSTGVLQGNMKEIGALCRDAGALLLVDAVTSLACVRLEVDAWGIDAVYSCSQKGLGCSPGLSPVSFSPRAVEVIKTRKTKVQSWYFDMTTVMSYWGQDRAYHHTGPISMVYGIHEGLRLVLEEGLENRWARHELNHRALRAGLECMGLEFTADRSCQLPQLNAVRVPAGVDDLAGRKYLLEKFGIEIGGGLGDFKGKVWRLGLMGQNSRPSVVLLALAALEQALTKQGVKLTPGGAVGAANAVYSQS
ncbi:MAG: alanine--glyoxylate aminotransferase family protein [Gemmataceae bacterium]|nr:alanine--glyoxylate aminotransferase family protein [Gemmataceae bacterium]